VQSWFESLFCWQLAEKCRSKWVLAFVLSWPLVNCHSQTLHIRSVEPYSWICSVSVLFWRADFQFFHFFFLFAAHFRVDNLNKSLDGCAVSMCSLLPTRILSLAPGDLYLCLSSVMHCQGIIYGTLTGSNGLRMRL